MLKFAKTDAELRPLCALLILTTYMTTKKHLLKRVVSLLSDVASKILWTTGFVCLFAPHPTGQNYSSAMIILLKKKNHTKAMC